MEIDLLSFGEEDTMHVARALGEILRPGDVVALTGELGAGKTVFCKGVGESLGIPAGRIASPSFTIVTEHRGRVPFCHIDVYRLSSVEEALDIGLDEALSGERVCLVEWAEKIRILLPNDRIEITFHILGSERRRLSITAMDDPRFETFRSRVVHLIQGG